MVKTLPFGSITVPSPGFGAMGISFGLGSNLSLEEAEPVLLKAIELGCTFWDTAVGPLSEDELSLPSPGADTHTALSRSCTKPASMRSSSAISSGSTTSATRSSVSQELFPFWGTVNYVLRCFTIFER